jgi:hypothetical protein
MPPVFGRHPPGPHPYDEALAALCRAPEDSVRAVARNLMYDHRVTQARERQLDELVRPPRTESTLRDAMTDYFQERVRAQRLPDFIHEDLNRENILNPVAVLADGLHPDYPLARILNVNGLAPVFRWAAIRSVHPLFDGFPNPGDSAGVLRWLDERFSQPLRVPQFIEAVLQALNAHAEKHPFQPAWCTMWTDLGEYLSQAPDRWAEVLGIPNDTGLPLWLIVLRYTVREAGTLCRPCQLDGGWFAYHFPSPPDSPVTQGGHPMDLGDSAPEAVLLREYIHQQIPHSLAHWSAARQLYNRRSGNSGTPLVRLRQAHHHRLAHQYGRNKIMGWMPNFV